jgi:hypothetical protein
MRDDDSGHMPAFGELDALERSLDHLFSMFINENEPPLLIANNMPPARRVPRKPRRQLVAAEHPAQDIRPDRAA